MRSSPSPVLEALGTTSGWGCVIFLTTAVGSWLGLSVAHGALPAPSEAIVPLGGAVIMCLFFPPAFLVCAAMFLAFYLPVRYESFWRTAAAVNFLAWLAYTAATAGYFY